VRVRVRTVVFGLLGLVVVLVLAALTAVGWQVVLGPRARAVTSRTFAVSDARLARGKYLVEGPAACFSCHSPHDLTNPELPIIEAKKGAGFVLPDPDLGTMVAPNITPDPETGIGSWTDDEVARAIQEGVAKDGRALFPIMPYLNFRHLDDEDLASIVVYLRSIPPVKNTLPARQLVFPLNFIVNTIPQPLTSHQPPPPRVTPRARGEYLVRTVASCQDCHTPTDDHGQSLPGMAFGGGLKFNDPTQPQPVFSLNITPDPSGISFFDEAMFAQTLRTGQVTGQMLSHIMPFEFYRNLTDQDLQDMWAYISTLPPVKHRISNTDPPTLCVICKQRHGLGNLNAAPAR
jgi:mono/diheme cytochrome c family protein